MNLIKLPLGGHKRYWIAEYQHIAIKLPPLKDQEKYAGALQMATQEVNLLRRLVEKYRTQKRGLMQKLLSGEYPIRYSCESRNPQDACSE
ncbi:MAG: hypothetical protein R1F54_04210 [Candidatus Zeuxoniibacter abyssi]|nr:MAG: hypothetical protein R1F54_04210 [Candidatus Persebacteraceae bacterium AB1(2)]